MSVSVFRLEHRYLKDYRHSKEFQFPTYCSPYGIGKVVDNDTFRKKYDFIHFDLLFEHNATAEVGDEHPNPSGDGLGKVFDENFLVGCTTYDALFDWFYGYIEDWLIRGFVVREYKVKKRYVGNSGIQCIFNRNDFISRKIIK